MTDNLFNVITESGDSFAVQDVSILVPGVEYYFTHIYDKNIYKGKFKEIYNKYEKIFIFETVDGYILITYLKYFFYFFQFFLTKW